MQKGGKFMMIILFLTLVLQVSAQANESRDILEKRVEEVNKVLPVSAMRGLVFQKKYISDMSVIEVHEVDELYISLSSLKNKRGSMKKTLLKRYKEEPNLCSFSKLVVDCNMDIVIQYVSKQSKKSFQIVLKTKELARLLNY